MNKRYIILALIALAVGAGMLFLPETKHNKEINPELLLNAIDDPSRFLSTDLITDRLVKKDPALMLIDVRPETQYKAFSIPGSASIPLDSLLTYSTKALLNNKEVDKVFYSNSDVMSDQAWIITKRAGVEGTFVMKGGVNKWFNDIVKAEKPAATEPTENIALYQFRIAARQYFFGSPDEKTDKVVVSPPKTAIQIIKKPVEVSSGGGC